ncbi:MAG: hypothetical protein ACREHG_05375, partial [Candidatus Saccharimonadales bacterium]
DMRSERDVSVWEKTHLAQLCQRYWSDNSVSVTVTFNEDEANEIPAVLRAFDGQLKSFSCMPIAEGTYAQAPYQRVSREVWQTMRDNVMPIDWDALYETSAIVPAGELFCSSDVCEVKAR